MKDERPGEPLTLRPIGHIRTAMRLKFEAPHQPENDPEQRNVIELLAGSGFERTLDDLQTFSHIWLLWWFNRNSSWRPMVLPPRGSAKRRGVFATRSPHRPNPLGLTAVRLHEVQKLTLVVGATDLLDGTPILDIKPYIPGIDSFPNASSGWLEEIESTATQPPTFAVSFSERAREQVTWLRENWKIAFIDRAVGLLARDPTPHRTRRITRAAGGLFRMGCGAWRVYFSVAGATVTIEWITPGYPRRLLVTDNYDRVADREAQLAFGEIWPTDD